jgi:tetratricopeptide (TPR) repeat protein
MFLQKILPIYIRLGLLLIIILLITLAGNTCNFYSLVKLNLGNISALRVIILKDFSSMHPAEEWLSQDMQLAAAYRNLARLYLAQDRMLQAIQAGEHAFALKPDDFFAAYWLGQAYWVSGNKDSARQIWHSNNIMQNKLDYLGWLCWHYAGQGDLASAEDALHQAMDLDPEWGPAYDALASLQWGHDWQKVSWALDGAIKYLPKGTAIWYWNIGRRHLINGNWSEAAQSLRIAADLQPTEWTLRFLVDALQRSGDTIGAAKVQIELDEFLNK